MHTTFSLKKNSLVLCFLAASLARADAQTPNDGTQIIGYNNNGYFFNTLTDLSSSPYTTFIDGFLQPSNGSTGSNPILGFDTQGPGQGLSTGQVNTFNYVENAGKNVLMSFGGAGVTSQQYAAFATGGTASNGHVYSAADATQTLANVLAAYVRGDSSYLNTTLATGGQSVAVNTYDHSGAVFRGFKGIDLDFEDTQSFQAGGSYNGTTFLSQLTLDLRAQLGGNYLITHAPQTPYLDANFTKGGGSYASTGGYSAIFANGYNTANPTASGAGLATNWLNVQFYNNAVDDGSGGGNHNVAGVVAAFEKLVTDNPGISPGKFVLTLPIALKNANTNFFTPAEITQIVSQINTYLKANNKGSIGGIAGFQLYNSDLNQSDMDAQNLAFANAFLAAVPEPSTWAFAAGGVVALGWTLRRRRI